MPTDVPHLAIDGFVETWEDAEHLAAVALRCMGFEAEVTGPGTDAGIDVAGPEVIGQVKLQARRVGRPELQRLVGAADGQRAFHVALASLRPIVVLRSLVADHHAEHLNRFAALRVARDQPDGYGTAESGRRRALEAGFDRHLTKPVAAETIQELVNALSSQHAAPRPA